MKDELEEFDLTENFENAFGKDPGGFESTKSNVSLFFMCLIVGIALLLAGYLICLAVINW